MGNTPKVAESKAAAAAAAVKAATTPTQSITITSSKPLPCLVQVTGWPTAALSCALDMALQLRARLLQVQKDLLAAEPEVEDELLFPAKQAEPASLPGSPHERTALIGQAVKRQGSKKRSKKGSKKGSK